jgi:hypothetical protein
MKNNHALILVAGLVMTNDLYRRTDKPLIPKTDLLNEYRLIKQKVSKLSANKRRAIVRAVESRA